VRGADGVLQVVGVDCAVQPGKVGLCRTELDAGSLVVRELEAGGARGGVAERLAAWCAAPGRRTLLALDAPLGWPVALGRALASHAAGAPVGTELDRLFSRETDRAVLAALGRRPLEVGADRIARTAAVALETLRALREATGLAIPLAWAPDEVGACAAVEVYPAGTLRALGLRSGGYKKKGDTTAREEILAGLGGLEAGRFCAQLVGAADLLDAAVCAVAGRDYLEGRATPPRAGQRELARREGWIWVRAQDG